MTLHLHRSDRADLLADQLAGLLADPLEDPFAEEVVVVPAKGVERWLTQRLSHRLGTGERARDGVCAGVRFLNPRSLVALLLDRERDDPWDPDRLVWPLLGVVDSSMGEPWCRALAAHLGDGLEGEEADLRRNRRYSVARRLAGLFSSYAVQRPELITAWRRGEETDGHGHPLPPDLAWQPELWRRLVAAVDAPPPDERHRDTLTALRDGAALALPSRLSLFGHTRLPVTEIELLAAVGEVRDVHLWLPQASPASWDALAEALGEGPVRRVDDDSALLVRHPLLSSLGRDSRELQRSLSGPAVTGAVDQGSTFADGVPPGPTLLHWLQDDLRHDRLPDPAARAARVHAPGDRSVQVHACHGASRQVDVLREVLVGLLEDDPTLEPRDILVMCPDIEEYAPLFQAAFGLAGVIEGGHPAHGLRVRLADRGLMSTNPLLAMAKQVVEIAGGRATATQVLDLASAEPVRQRFGFGDDDLATVTGWVEQSGVRWGLAADLRSSYRLEGFGQNTWQAGLDRVLLGVAMAEEDGRWLGSTLPLDDVGSASVELAGRFAELVERLERCVRRLQVAGAVEDWVDILRDGVLGLGAVRPSEAWQVAQFERELARIGDSGEGSAGGTALRLADVRTLLELRLRGRPTRANFRTGSLTVSTMVPMRSVPHRVLCLVGLDDGVFPRSVAVDGDDVLARDPMTGERDVRSEDRQLLLDAILAAGEKLVVTYTGANEHSGQPRPPAVPLGELLDALDVTASGPVRDTLLVRHPLQPFDRRNLTAPGASGAGEPDTVPFSFDRSALSGARAAAGPRTPPVPLIPGPLPAEVVGDLTLADLQAFFAHPAKAFLRRRLDVGVPQEYEEVDDAIPVELDALTAWAIGDRILRQAIRGAEPVGVFLAEQYRGELPPGELGQRFLRDVITDRVNALYVATAAARAEPSRTVDVTVDLGGGRRLTGVVPDVRSSRVVRVHYSNLGPKHRMTSWIDLLALSAGLPDHSWTASTYGWHKTRTPQHSLLGPLDHTASDLLRDLVDVFDRGQREPLPLPLKTGFAWADSLRSHSSPDWPARRAWETQSGSSIPGEQDDPHHVRVFGRRPPMSVLLEPPLEDEAWNDQKTRLGQYAVRVWQPLFAHEQVGSA